MLLWWHSHNGVAIIAPLLWSHYNCKGQLGGMITKETSVGGASLKLLPNDFLFCGCALHLTFLPKVTFFCVVEWYVGDSGGVVVVYAVVSGWSSN